MEKSNHRSNVKFILVKKYVAYFEINNALSNGSWSVLQAIDI